MTATLEKEAAAIGLRETAGGATGGAAGPARGEAPLVGRDLARAFEGAVVPLAVVDAAGRVTWCNPAFGGCVDRPAVELAGRSISEVLYDAQVLREIRIMLHDEPGRPSRFRVRTGPSVRGGGRVVEWYGAAIPCGAAGAGVVLGGWDVTGYLETIERLSHAALHDSLTGLANRVLFLDRLRHAVARGERQAGFKYAVAYVDLDGFKVINDRLGHRAGDEVLITVARRVQRSVRAVDTVGRLGGDEFGVLLEGLADVSLSRAVAGRIQRELATPCWLADEMIVVRASIGIAAGGEQGVGPADLVARADSAMYRAKTLGGNRLAAHGEGSAA
jgi:diguanylate cyclase (GGDEF)-like protein